MNGLLNVFKPPAWSSRDVVEAVRIALGADKAGHAGTLDPGAVGVLLVLTGRATRLQQYFVQLPKLYLAEMTLGIATDTGDAFGEVQHVDRRAPLDDKILQKVLPQFVGEVRQVPPMASAAKVDGRPLYEHARRGRKVQREARFVRISPLRLLNYRSEWPPRALLQIGCSSGTYVRTLVEDLAREAGTCAHMSFLVRAEVGRFSADASTPVRRVTGSDLVPAACALDFLPAIRLQEGDARLIRHGAAARSADVSGYRRGEQVRILNMRGRLLGLGEIRDRSDSKSTALFPRRVFPEPL